MSIQITNAEQCVPTLDFIDPGRQCLHLLLELCEFCLHCHTETNTFCVLAHVQHIVRLETTLSPTPGPSSGTYVARVPKPHGMVVSADGDKEQFLHSYTPESPS
jgi:hypothetical protein